MSEMITIQEAARLINRNASTIQNWIRQGALPHTRGKIAQWKGKPGTTTGFLVDREALIALDETRARHALPRNHSRRKVAESEYQTIAEAYAYSRDTLDKIGKRYGVTRERIRQIIDQHHPWASKQRRENIEARRTSRDERELWYSFREAMTQAITNDLKCVVCGAWVLRSGHGRAQQFDNMTCSEEHAEAWHHLRTFDNWEGHRISQAKAVLNNPQSHKPSQIALAHKVLDGTAPPADRRYFSPGSERAEAILKYRPEEFKKIVMNSGPRTKTWKAYFHILSDEELDQALDLQAAKENQVSD